MILEHEHYARVMDPKHPGFGEIVKVFSEDDDGRYYVHFASGHGDPIRKEDLSFLSVEVTREEIQLFGTLLHIYETENPFHNETLSEIKELAFRELQERFGKQKTRDELEAIAWWQSWWHIKKPANEIRDFMDQLQSIHTV